MKRLYTYILLLSCIVLIGCTDEYDEGSGLYPTLVPRYISVSPTSFTFEAKTTEKKTIEISSTETPWIIDNMVDWVSLSANTGSLSSSIQIGVKENTSGDDARLGIFYVKSNVEDWKYESPINVSQAGAEPYILPDKDEFDLPGSVNETSFSVSSNCTWDVSANVSWLTVTKKGSDVSFSTTANEFTAYRSGIITLTHQGTKNASSNINIRQAPASITASTETLTFNNTAGMVELTIKAEAAWTASSSSSWIELSPSYGNSGTSTMKINVSPNTSINDRTGYVLLYVGGNQRIQIPVRQRGIYVEVAKTNLAFKAKGESLSIDISSNTSWVVKDLPRWAIASKTSGNGDDCITITANTNNSVNQRSAVFKITQEGLTIGNSVTITQDGKFFDVSAQSLTFEDVASTKSIEIRAEDSWTLRNDNSWVNISQTSSSGTSVINIDVSENETESLRQGIIYITMLDKTIPVSITQKAKIFNADVDNKSLVFPAAGGISNLNVISNTNWSISDCPTWLSLSQTSGKGNATVTVTAEENVSSDERVGTMLLRIDGKSGYSTINVRQSGKSISLTPSELAFTSNASTQNVNVTSDGKWNVSTSESWLSVSPISGEGNATLKVSVTENMSVSQRSGIVSVFMGGKVKTLPVTQNSKSFGLTPMSLSFTDKSSTQSIAVETDGAWSATTDESWITISPASASGSSTLMVTVTENTTNATRNGTISVTMGDKTLNVPVSQNGKFLTIANTVLSYTSKGGSIDITISTNDSWTARVEGDVTWISLSQTSGTGAANIKVIAADNPSVNKRTGYVVIETPHGQNVRVLLTQDARYLTIDNNALKFYSKGGTSEPITVTTDGTYSISTSQSWLTVAQSANTFTVTATENTGVDARFGKIIIALTDLQEGTYSLTLDVTQLNYGGTFLKTEYGDDKDWDNMGNSSGNLTITTFGEDENYDTNTTSGTTLSVTGYSSDKNWDSSSNSGVRVSITGFNPDRNLDTNPSSSGTISKTGYESDKNWN